MIICILPNKMNFDNLYQNIENELYEEFQWEKIALEFLNTYLQCSAKTLKTIVALMNITIEPMDYKKVFLKMYKCLTKNLVPFKYAHQKYCKVTQEWKEYLDYAITLPFWLYSLLFDLQQAFSIDSMILLRFNESYSVLFENEPGVPGPVGPQGPQGPPSRDTIENFKPKIFLFR